MSYSIKNLTTKSCSLLKKIEILLFANFITKFIENMNKVDCIYLDGTDAKCGTTDRVNESLKLGCVRQKSATIAQSSNVSTYKEVRVIPLAIMVGAPSCKLFIYKLAILIKKAIS